MARARSLNIVKGLSITFTAPHFFTAAKNGSGRHVNKLRQPSS